MKKILSLLLLALSAASLQAAVLFQDSTNYPYVNGPIAGQGQWYVYSSGTASNDTIVSNNVIYLTSSGHDSVATPTNGFYHATNGNITYASFTFTVNKLPSYSADDYFVQFLSTNGNKCCNIFITRNGTVVPNTYRLAVANFSVSFSNLQPPVTFPEDLATNVTYTIVIAYDTEEGSTTEGANLLIDPSAQDYNNLIYGDYTSSNGIGYGFAYGTDVAVVTNENNLEIGAIGLSPYVDAGFSNVIAGTTFADVYNTSTIAPPVFGVQPYPSYAGSNYSGNSATLYSLAAGADVAYQWYSATSGILTDGTYFTGSQSNILTLNNLVGPDTYYVVATDANGHSVTSSNYSLAVITTPTPVFFSTNAASTNLTNNLFTTAYFSDYAAGTGPIGYQWYFKSTNASSSFVALSGQTNPYINVYLADFTAPGQYYVLASNTLSGTTYTAFGPTNTLVEIAPLIATLGQIHGFLNSAAVSGNPGGTIVINSNNLVTSGYVSVYHGYGSTYSEFFIQDTNGYGVEVYLGSHGNTNTPPIGSFVTITGELEVYKSAVEMAPSTASAIVVNSNVPPVPLHPFLGNPFASNFLANPIGSNSLRYSCSLVTFTNVYIYGTKTGGAIGTGGNNSGLGGIFTSNSYCVLYFTVGAYDATTNNLTFEIFQPTYNIGTTTNEFAFKPIPTYCAQLTGVLAPYGGSPNYDEVIPSRYADYATNSPAPFTVSYAETNKTLALTWPAVAGNTYSVNATSSGTAPYTNVSYGIGYYPTNGSYTETVSNSVAVKLFQVTSP
jgi:hypothetical protein